MPTGWYGTICCICFGNLDLTNAFIDENNQAWDTHSLVCAYEAGMTTIPPTKEEWVRFRNIEWDLYLPLIKEQTEEESALPRWEDEGGLTAS